MKYYKFLDRLAFGMGNKIPENAIEITEEEFLEATKIPDVLPENNKINKQARISQLKKMLSDTDYQAIKYAEGELSEEEYAPIKAQRRAWREEINQLTNK